MEVADTCAQGTSPRKALVEGVDSAWRSGAVTGFVQGTTVSGASKEALAEVETLLRSGSSSVFITGGIPAAMLVPGGADMPLPFSGRGILQLTGLSNNGDNQEETLPFVMTASGVLQDGTWPLPSSNNSLNGLSLPILLQTGQGLPYLLRSSVGQVSLSTVKIDCSEGIVLSMTATGTISPLNGCKWPRITDQDSNYDCAEDTVKLRNGATVVFIEATMPTETDSLETESAGVKFSSGSNSVLRSGSNTVYLTGGIQPALLQTDGALPIPFIGSGRLNVKMAVDGGTSAGGDTVSEGTLPFALEATGTFAIPKAWLVDGALPLPRARELSKLVIDLGVHSGLTLPKGLKGTGKLTIPEPEDGTNPWPSIPKDMLPWVVTGSGTIALEDGTWPLPRSESRDRMIAFQTPAGSNVAQEPVHPDDSSPVVVPEATKASPDPINPEDVPPSGSDLLGGPSKAGPDPAPTEDRRNEDGSEQGDWSNSGGHTMVENWKRWFRHRPEKKAD
ncbi:hypothetical protein P389DRAFT_198571 [Cystobasidium minutum MCA 4210]|uniref:uncharacterized protein n=1 Tax=Cystobasidium minutum MCA 4210 TaxID=1397322 RepID=UPI0034CFE90A|eukprot:jgi/Rhomi1/198571/gm1.6785_g